MSDSWSSVLADWLWSAGKVSAVVVGIMGCIVAYIATKQDKLLYMPQPPGYPTDPSMFPPAMRSPAAYDAALGWSWRELEIPTSDGELLHGWAMLQVGARAKEVPTLVFWHGNAGSVGSRLPMAAFLWAFTGCNVVMIDYRGFGKSTGVPSEAGLQLDGEAALEFLGNMEAIDSCKIVLFGRSLGGALVAANTATAPIAGCALPANADNACRAGPQVAAIVMENTFTSIADMVDKIMPTLAPLKGLVQRIFWPSLEYMAHVRVPALLISGTHDTLVPPWMMTRLNDALVHAPHVLVSIPGGQHNNCWAPNVGRELYYRSIKDFAAQHTQSDLKHAWPWSQENLLKVMTVVTAPGEDQMQIPSSAAGSTYTDK